MNNKWLKQYDQAIFRVSENYLMPDQMVGGVSREEFERTLAANGVDARWVGVYDHGGPRFKSRFIPLSKLVPCDLTDKLKRWVDIIHAAGMNAITWCGICTGAAERPDWRSVRIDGTQGGACINSPYGDALIGMALEFFEKFDLDGIYFDGATLDFPFGQSSPVPGCICPTCSQKFKKETGYESPHAVDFEDKVFRTWVKWRFDMYSAYFQKLVNAIHNAYPDKVITINHYHRYSPYAWHTACPLDLYECNIVTGSESALDTVLSSFSSKIAVAYGRKAEVWTPCARWMVNTPWQIHEPSALMHHAAACITAGAYPSFGVEIDLPKGSLPATVTNFLKPAAEFLKKRAPYIELASANPVALHISQQAETFFFSRHVDKDGCYGWYWESLIGWNEMLEETGLGTDIIFDSHLDAQCLSRYRMVILPLSLCLSDAQAQALQEYVGAGGVLVLGPWSGRLDTQGEPLADNGILAAIRSVDEGRVPPAASFVQDSRAPSYLENLALKLHDLHGFGVFTMMAKQTAREGSEVLMSTECGAAVTKRPYGKGWVIDLAPDWGVSFFFAPSSPMRKIFTCMALEAAVIPVIVKAPACVKTGLRRTGAGSCLVHLHNCPATIHHQGNRGGSYMPIIPRDIIPVCDVNIEVRGLRVSKAKKLVERPGNLSVETKGDLSVIRLERLDLHEIVQISFTL